MNGAFLFLLTRSAVNVVIFRLQRLRQPKYLAGAVVGALYFYFYFYRFLFRGGATAPAGAFPEMAGMDEMGAEVGALLLAAVILVFSWFWPSSRAALHFTEAEIAWLFPAPLDRPALIRFKLLKGQLGLLFLSLFMTILSGRILQGAPAWMHLIGWWIILSTLQLHRLGASFTLQRLTERGLADGRRRLLVLLVAGALGAVLYFWQRAAPQLPELGKASATTDWTQWLQWLHGLVHSGPAPWLLWPFRAIVAPWAANDLPSFLRALPGAFGLMALHYWWVVRSHVSFEEASIALSQKVAAVLAARRSGERRVSRAPRAAQQPLFPLRPLGWAPVAFYWKHTLATGGLRHLRIWTGAAVAIVGGALAMVADGRWPAAQFMAAMISGIVLVVVFLLNGQTGAQAVRRDLGSGEWLKTFPVPGWQTVLGQLIGPVVGGTVLQWLALSVVFICTFTFGESAPRQVGELAAAIPWSLFLAAALLLPALNLAMMIIPTAASLLFPAWFKPGEQNTRGMEMTGMRLILVFGQIVAVGLALLPALLLGASAWVVLGMFSLPAWSPIGGAAAAALTLSVEAGLGVLWLGSLLDRFDVSE